MPQAQRAVVGDRPFDVENFGGFSGDRDANWGQNREAMARGHFSGFTGNLLQEDTVTQISMGAIADRTREHLSSSDVAIIHARRALLDALGRVQQGQHPLVAGPSGSLIEAAPTDVVLPPEHQEASPRANGCETPRLEVVLGVLGTVVMSSTASCAFTWPPVRTRIPRSRMPRRAR